MFSDFGDSYRIYRACELVFTILQDNIFSQILVHKKFFPKLPDIESRIDNVPTPQSTLRRSCQTFLIDSRIKLSAGQSVSLYNSARSQQIHHLIKMKKYFCKSLKGKITGHITKHEYLIVYKTEL